MPDRFGHGFPGASGHPWFAAALMLLVFAVLIGVIIWAVVRITRTDALRRLPGAIPPPAPPVGTAMGTSEDAALAALRLRYARGEIDRQEYARVSSDLGGTIPPESA